MKLSLLYYLATLFTYAFSGNSESFAQSCSITALASKTTPSPDESTLLSADASFSVTNWQWYKDGAPIHVSSSSPFIYVKVPGKYTVIATGAGCGTTESNTVEIVANISSVVSGNIAGLANPCLRSQVSYSIAPVSDAVSYNWTVPNDWTIIYGQGKAAISVSVGRSDGQISVQAVYANGQKSELVDLAVGVSPYPASTGGIQGNDEARAGSTAVFSMPTVTDATMYRWAVPEGWTIQNGQGTRAVTVMVGSTGGDVVFEAYNNCGHLFYKKNIEVTTGILNNKIETTQTRCYSETRDARTITGSLPTTSNPNESMTFQWESSTDQNSFFAIAGATGKDYKPHVLYTTTWYRRKVIIGATSQYSNVALVTVVPLPDPPVADDVKIEAGTVATLEVKFPQAHTTYYWYNEAGENIGKGPVFYTQPLTANSIFYVTVMKDCESKRKRVEVSLVSKMPAPVAANEIICAGSNTILRVESVDPALTYSWYATAAGGIPLAMGVEFISSALTQTITYFLQVDGMKARTAVTVEVVPAVSNNFIEQPQALCAGDIPLPFAGSVPVGGSGSYFYSWEISMDGITFIPVLGATTSSYYHSGTLSQTTWFRRVVTAEHAGCENISEAVKVSVLVPVANNKIVAPTPLCAGNPEPRVITGSVPTGGNETYCYQWQRQKRDGSFVSVPDAVSQDFQLREINESTWFRRVVTSAGCESVSAPVEFRINTTPAKPLIMQQDNQLSASVSGTTYAWLFDGLPLPDSNTQSIVMKSSGYYQVSVQNSEGCFSFSDSLQVTLQIPAVTEQQETENLVLAPNPCRGKVKLLLSDTWHEAQVQVIDMMGKVMYQAYYHSLAEQEIDLSILPTGTYVLRVQTPKMQSVQRLIMAR